MSERTLLTSYVCYSYAIWGGWNERPAPHSYDALHLLPRSDNVLHHHSPPDDGKPPDVLLHHRRPHDKLRSHLQAVHTVGRRLHLRHHIRHTDHLRRCKSTQRRAVRIAEPSRKTPSDKLPSMSTVSAAALMRRLLAIRGATTTTQKAITFAKSACVCI